MSKRLQVSGYGLLNGFRL